MEHHIGCVVMAAGNASRFAANKLTAEFGGKPLIERALDAVPPSLETVVVTQYPEIEKAAARRGFAVRKNLHPDWGVSHTIRLGVEALEGCDAILFTVADQPLLTRASVEAVVARWQSEPDCIAALSHNGRRGNPCIFPKTFFPELSALTGDLGGSVVIRNHPELLRLVPADASELLDVDTPEALDKLRRQAQDEGTPVRREESTD